MNRPRNRQPRQNNNNRGHPQRGPSQTRGGNVPSSQQVIPGASVSIVLKADQSTGREVQGVVKDLLSRGDHPRGIKVRLQDGRIGRVQRMSPSDMVAVTYPRFTPEPTRTLKMESDRRRPRDADDDIQMPPSRTLADFIPTPAKEEVHIPSLGEQSNFSSAAIKCPICGLFEGDETAVSHHVQEHLT